MAAGDQPIISNSFNHAIEAGIKEGISSYLTKSYGNPFEKIIKETIESHEGLIRTLLTDSISSCLKDSDFKEDIRQQVRKNLAKTLVARFGGEIEKQVNVLKSDPTTRARIVTAIDEIVRNKNES